jgi:soluble lytic murein transglycosylase-like protein
LTDWKQGGEPYLPTLAGIEQTYSIPTDLLSRVAFQECSWRPEVIAGTVKSPVGAVGMFQLMPQFFSNAGISWQTDAVIAAKYLVDLHGQFDDDWQLAVAAYNWGPGNLRKWIEAGSDHEKLPNETAAYITKVFGDVPIDGVILNA